MTQSGKGAQDSEAEFASVWQDEIAHQHVVDGGLEKPFPVAESQHWETQSVCLSYSASGATGTPRQAVLREASTQTEKLATMLPRPPGLPSSRERGTQQKGRDADFQRARKLRTIARVPSTKRALTFDMFAETPSDMMSQQIGDPAYSINPLCPPGCCSLHKNLKFMRQHIGFMLQSVRCQHLSSDDRLQCVACSHVQPIEDDDEFRCDNCDGEVAREKVLNEVSSDAQADDEY